jgi:uncharacterized protein (TIGR02996 family)
MTEQQQLLAAIMSDKGDDTVRLVYADWLQEHGQEERAEFIRVQCELERHTKYIHGIKCHDIPVLELLRRERELWVNYGLGWLSPTTLIRYDSLDPEVHDLVWKRGFVEKVTITAEDFITHADEIYWHPKQRIIYYDDTVQRECPLTAQPLTKVVLTTVPDVNLTIYNTPHEAEDERYVHLRAAATLGGMRFTNQCSISRREIEQCSDRVSIVQLATERLTGSLHPRYLLPKRYEGIEFELPSENRIINALIHGNNGGQIIQIEAGEDIRVGDLITSDINGRAIRYSGNGPIHGRATSGTDT